MYCLIVFVGDVMDMYGPFPTAQRAEEYLRSATLDHVKLKWIVKELIVPYSVVRTVLWRESIKHN